MASGKAFVAFKHLPLRIHQNARAAAVAAVCAQGEGLFWGFYSGVFRRPAVRSPGQDFSAALTDAGMQPGAAAKCASPAAFARIDGDIRAAERLGISNTPTFLIGINEPGVGIRTTSVIVGAKPLVSFREAIDDALGLGRPKH